MTAIPSFIAAADVAQMMGLTTAQTFLRQRDDLEMLGFPLPCPWSSRPLKWRSDLVAAWIAGQGLPRNEAQPLRLVGGNAALMARAATA